MSYCLGSQSNYQHGSQSHKMSIGMIDDSLAKRHCGSTKETWVSNKQALNGVSNQEHLGQNVKRDFKASGSINTCNENVRESSTRSKSGSLTGSVLKKDTAHIENQPSRPAMSSDEQGRPSFSLFPNTGGLRPVAGKKIDVGFLSGKEGKGSVTTDRFKEPSSGDKQEVFMPAKEVIQDQPMENDNRCKETLRMKLQEVLGAGFSPSMRSGNLRTIETDVDEVMHEQTQKGDAHHFNVKQNSDNKRSVNSNTVEKGVDEVMPKKTQKGDAGHFNVKQNSDNKRSGNSRTVDKVLPEKTQKGETGHFKFKKNSDTIESDSENPDVTAARVVTRSLAKKRVTTKTSPRNLKTKSLSCGKTQHQAKKVLSSAKKSKHTQPREVNFDFLMPDKVDHDKRSFEIKPDDKLFHKKDTVNVQRVMSGYKKLPQTEDFPLGGRRISSEYTRHNVNLEPVEAEHDMNYHSPSIREKFQQQMGEFPLGGRMRDRDYAHQNVNPEPEEAAQSKFFNDSPIIREKNQQQDTGCPAPVDEPDHHDSSQQSPVEHDVNFSSPWLNMTTTVPRSPMSSPPPVNENGSVESKGEASPMDPYVFKSTPATVNSTRSSDEAATPVKSYGGTPELSTEGKETENESFTSEEREFDWIRKVPSAKKETEVDRSNMSFRAKRQCNHAVDRTDPSLTLHSPTDAPHYLSAGESTDDALAEDLEDHAEDGLARVVSLSGLTLERVNKKIMSMTSKRCSDILMSAAEEIHSKLQEVDSMVQMDVGKLTNLNKSKRKYTEAGLQEQNQNLNAIYEKFKDEIRNYLQDCRGQMDLLEEQHVEIKAAIEKQKASHRKLLSQAETAVKTQLNDTERRITSIHKLGKQKVLQLKLAIAECLEDGITD